MMPELTLSSGEAILFKPSSLRKFRGIRLQGSEYWLAERAEFAMHFQQFIQPSFDISYRIFSSFIDTGFYIREQQPGWRIEAVLEGELMMKGDESTTLLKAGEYHVTNELLPYIHLSKETNCKYLTAQLHAPFSDNYVAQLDSRSFKGRMPHAMHDLLVEFLQNRFQENLLPLYYENCVRELFFLHAAKPALTELDLLSDAELRVVYEADRIIREDLHVHFSIQELARKTGTNEYKLKKDFRTVFEVGLFGRLIQLRMQQAKLLLETTSLPVKDIAEQAGYESSAGFITAFRRRYGLPPREWRESNKR